MKENTLSVYCFLVYSKHFTIIACYSILVSQVTFLRNDSCIVNFFQALFFFFFNLHFNPVNFFTGL